MTSKTSTTRKTSSKKTGVKKATAKKPGARKAVGKKAGAKAARTTVRKAVSTRSPGGDGAGRAAKMKLTLLERLEGLGLLNQDTIEQLEKKAESMKEASDGLGQAAAWDRMLHSGLGAIEAGSGDASHKRVLQALVTWQESLLSLPATSAGLEEAVTGLKKIVPYHGASLFIRNPDRKSIEPAATVGFPVELIGRIRFAEGHGFSSWVAARKRPVLYSSLHRNEAPGSEHVRSFMGVPLVVGSESLGVLNLGHREEEAYDPAALRRLMVAATMLAGLVQRCIAQRQIRAREILDPATGLATASYLRARLDEEVIRCRELGHSMSLVVFRLKELGDFTEQYGADFRDRCRADLAGLAQGWRRPTELVGLGKADTLVAILPSARVERARDRAEAMAGAVEKHNFPRRKRMSVEFGMATYPADAESPQELLEAVDKSLREASPAPGETETCALPVAM